MLCPTKGKARCVQTPFAFSAVDKSSRYPQLQACRNRTLQESNRYWSSSLATHERPSTILCGTRSSTSPAKSVKRPSTNRRTPFRMVLDKTGQTISCVHHSRAMRHVQRGAAALACGQGSIPDTDGQNRMVWRDSMPSQAGRGESQVRNPEVEREVSGKSRI